MKVTRYSDADFAERMRDLAAPSSLFDLLIEERTRTILNDVHQRGDAALLELTERFDRARLTTE